MNKFLKEFKDRGFFYQCTGENELSKQLDEEKIKAYIWVAYYKLCVCDYFKKMDINQ